MNAVIQTPICPILSRPSGQGDLADEGLYGMKVNVLRFLVGGLCKAETHYGYTGFVAVKHLLLDQPAVHSWAAGAKRMVSHKNFCDVLPEPSVRARAKLTLPKGALLQPVGTPEDGWQKVRLCNGQEGYTRSSILSEYYEKPPDIGESALRRRLQDTALGYLGTPYRWGGKTPLGLDCSGLTFMAYYLNGILIWRDAQLKPGYPVREIDPRHIQRGDLLFFPGHVAMYLEEGRYLHATAASGSDGVTVNSLAPGAPDYRADLADSILAAGSVFPC